MLGERRLPGHKLGSIKPQTFHLAEAGYSVMFNIDPKRVATAMTALYPTPSPNHLRFACPHCSTVLHVPMDQCEVAGPCPKCWQNILPPALDEHGQPLDFTPAKTVATPFQPKYAVPPIQVTQDKGREREVRARVQHSRRMEALYRKCENFLKSRALQTGKVVLCISLVGFLGFTYRYMKKNQWNPWWKTPDPVAAPALIRTSPSP